jgi:hypothetical protein
MDEAETKHDKHEHNKTCQKAVVTGYPKPLGQNGTDGGAN